MKATTSRPTWGRSTSTSYAKSATVSSSKASSAPTGSARSFTVAAASKKKLGHGAAANAAREKPPSSYTSRWETWSRSWNLCVPDAKRRWCTSKWSTTSSSAMLLKRSFKKAARILILIWAVVHLRHRLWIGGKLSPRSSSQRDKLANRFWPPGIKRSHLKFMCSKKTRNRSPFSTFNCKLCKTNMLSSKVISLTITKWSRSA